MHRFAIIPSALIDHLAVQLFPSRGGFLAVDHRKHRTGHHRDIRAPYDFEQPQRVLHFFVAPRIAGHHSDTEHVRLRGIHDRKYCLHVRAARAGAILIDNHFVLVLRK